MGKVFTWNEIERTAVPTRDYITLTAKHVMGQLAVCGAVKTAVVCGSVIRGDHTVRSDIDCLVIYEADRSREAFAVMQQLSMVAARMFVPVTFIPCGSNVAQTRMHHLGPSFWKHVERSALAGGVIKGWPTDVDQKDRSEAAELESYLRVKLYSLQEQWAEFPSKSPEAQAHTLKKMLEAPLHVARKTLARVSTLQGDSKATTWNQYKDIMPSTMVLELEGLMELDVFYTRSLLEALKDPSQVNYEDLLGYLEAHVPDVLGFVDANVQFVSSHPAP